MIARSFSMSAASTSTSDALENDANNRFWRWTSTASRAPPFR